MLHIELKSGALYSVKIEYYDILISKQLLEIIINTNRRGIKYELTLKNEGFNELVSIRNNIARILSDNTCWIKDDTEHNSICIGELKFEGKRAKCDFLLQ